MHVKLRWDCIADANHDELWEVSPAIYAYTHGTEILYIGKADGSSTVRSRWEAHDKNSLFRYFDRELRIDWHNVLVGEFLYGGRLTKQMVADVESLLINKLQPCGNISATRSRIPRPGMSVQCVGIRWPHRTKLFVDVE